MIVPNNWFWCNEPLNPSEAVVFDIDGVLANGDCRQHFLESPKKDWKSFFAACGEDTVIEETARLLAVIDPGTAIVLLTGRPIEVHEQTTKWLGRYELRWDLLVMRSRGDYSGSLEFKRQTVRRLKAMSFDLRVAFEDDRKNKDMFESEGVPCFYIHSGYYEARDAEEAAAQS